MVGSFAPRCGPRPGWERRRAQVFEGTVERTFRIEIPTNFPIDSHDPHLGNPLDTQRVERRPSPVGRRPGDLAVLQKLLHVQNVLSGVTRQADEHDAPVFKRVVGRNQVRRFGKTRPAPIGPRVDHQHFAFQTLRGGRIAVDPTGRLYFRHEGARAQSTAVRMAFVVHDHRESDAENGNRYND